MGCALDPAFWPPLDCTNSNTKVPENEIVGEALVALLHDDLKSMGVTSVGHRLTILKSVYDVKKAQDIPIESDHYIPLCKSGSCLFSCPRPSLFLADTY